MKPIDLMDRRFGRLLVVTREENDRFGKARWRCRCDCGKDTITRSNTLLKGETLSCGCLFQEKRALGSKRSHGQSRTFLYRVWCVAKGRCYNPTDQHYARYGGRGITMCDRWRESFAAFIQDMGPRPAGMTLDRIDNDGPYSPENCRWATHTTQMRNMVRNRHLTFKGETLTIAEWAERTGLPYGALFYRIQQGWSVEDALTTPSRRTQ